MSVHRIKDLLLTLFFLGPIWLSGQIGGATLKIEGDAVVFYCSVDQLDSLYKAPFSIIHDFDSLRLANAIEQQSSFEELNNQWIFQSKDKTHFVLKKPLDHFEEEYRPMDKYMILPDYWMSPLSQLDSSVLKAKPRYEVNKNGNTKFLHKGDRRAKRVVLCGSFNNWDEDEIVMNKVGEGWEIILDLEPGIYEYKFIVDGDWTHDKSNPLKLENEHHTYNSILLIGERVTFTFDSDEKKRGVYLAGSFNNWDDRSIPLEKNGDTWSVTIDLPPGKHYYKFVADYQWLTDPKNKLMENDDEGIMNSVLIVN